MSVCKVRIKKNGSRHPISVVDVEKCPSSACCERKKSKLNNPKNMKKKSVKIAQNRRCTPSKCHETVCKV